MGMCTCLCRSVAVGRARKSVIQSLQNPDPKCALLNAVMELDKVVGALI